MLTLEVPFCYLRNCRHPSDLTLPDDEILRTRSIVALHRFIQRDSEAPQKGFPCGIGMFDIVG